MEQQRLFTLAVEAVTIGGTYVPGEGWCVRVASRRQGDPWGDDPWTVYSRLSTSEMVQAIEDDLSSRL